MSEEVKGLVRHLLTFGGGVLVSMGYMDNATAAQLVGAVSTIVGIIWSYLDKKQIK